MSLKLSKILLLFLLLIAFTVPLAIIIGQLLNCDKSWCVYIEVDANSGDIRFRRYIAFIEIYEKIQENSFSKRAKELSSDKKQVKWELDSIVGTILYRSFILGDYHGSQAIIKQLSELVEEGKLSDKMVLKCADLLAVGELDQIMDITMGN